MKKLALILVFLALCVLAAGYFAPALIARGMEIGFERVFGGEVEVSLAAYPSLRLLLGRFDSIAVVAKNVTLGDVVARQYTVAAEGVAVNMRALLFRREIELSEQGDVNVSIVIAEAELTRLLWAEIPELNGWQIMINPGLLIAQGKAPILGSQLDMQVTGTLVPAPDGHVRLVVLEAMVAGVKIPPAILQAVLGKSDFYIDLSAAPMPLVLQSVGLEAGQLVISATTTE